MIEAALVQAVATVSAAAMTAMGAMWSHQSRDAVRSLERRVGSIEQVLMGGGK